MKVCRILIGTLLAASVICNTSCKEQKNVELISDATMVSLLQGIWIDKLDENVVFKISSDSLFFAENENKVATYIITPDTFYINTDKESKYVVQRLTQSSFYFTNPQGDQINLVKSTDPADASVFSKSNVGEVVDINQQLLKRDTVVVSGETRYHCYMQVNPTTYKVVTSNYNDEGINIGNVYYDNIVNLTVYSGASRLHSSDYSKQHFAKYLPAEVLPQTILSDITYDHCDEHGVYFIAKLGIPESASSYLIELHVDASGKVTMKQP